MEKLRWFYKVTRPVVVIAGVLGTWVISIVSNGHDIMSVNKIAAAASMGFSCLGSSVCHFGIAHKIYKDKWYDPVSIKRPYLFVLSGLGFFSISILIPFLALPPACVNIAISIPLAIILYGKFLSKHWTTKTLVIATVCITPALMGWWAGSHTPKILPYAIGIIFFAYIAREITLDIRDIQANKRKRRTLPIQFGIENAMRVAGISVIISISLCLLLLFNNDNNLMVSGLIATAICLFLFIATTLLTKNTPASSQNLITIAVYCLIIAVLITGIQQNI
jgi:4-hydroxybenzoate polyprenyltransferase